MAARRTGLPLMKYLRVQVDTLPLNNQSPLRLLPNFFLRHFSEEVRGSFLDKSEVTDRVVSCVKNFQKVDPSKVLLILLLLLSISSSQFSYWFFVYHYMILLLGLAVNFYDLFSMIS
jgi:hypothetical protein